MRKRLFDVMVSLAILLFFSPFFLLAAILVRLSSKGPLFFSHERVGKEGKAFRCYKFRTMYENAQERLEPLLAANPGLMQEWKTFFKLKQDPRVTPIGKVLRKTSLDELPQLWNVLKGDMSVVGPRPMTEHEVRHYLKEKAATILSVRPGLTSLWIVLGRNQFSLEKRIEMEEYYVLHRSFGLDCKVILQTAWVILFPKGAY